MSIQHLLARLQEAVAGARGRVLAVQQSLATHPRLALALRVLAHRYTLFVAGMMLYSAGVQHLVTGWRNSQLYTEAPLLLGLYAASDQLMRRNRWRPLAAALPFILVYVAHDLYLHFLSIVPDWAQVRNTPELFEVLNAEQIALVILLFGAPALVWLTQLDPRALRTRRITVLVPVLLLLAMVRWAPSAVTRSVQSFLHPTSWSPQRNVRYYGRIFMSLARAAQQAAWREGLAAHQPDPGSRLFPDAATLAAIVPRRVHVVILESLVDPRQFTALSFSRSPVADELTSIIGETTSASLSPGFGGGTAKAEFEVLCGVPALGLYGAEEFNAFTGAPVRCLPRILSDAGYTSSAADPFRPVFYNAVRAYQGIGFSQALFLDRFAPSGAAAISSAGSSGRYLFDGLLYEQVLERLKAKQGPILNYILTMYGHTPFALDADQPRVVEVTPREPLLEIIANQTYYRTRALAAYIRALFALDPDALFVAVADHLPPLPGGEGDYDRLGFRGHFTGGSAERIHEAFLLVIDRGRAESVGLVHHFDLHALILDRLSGSAYCRRRGCDFASPRDADRHVADYTTIMSMAVQPEP